LRGFESQCDPINEYTAAAFEHVTYVSPIDAFQDDADSCFRWGDGLLSGNKESLTFLLH
jgi:hypothetical protein